MKKLRRIYYGSPHLVRAAMSPLLRFEDSLAALHWELGIPRDYPTRGIPRHEPPTDLVACDGCLLTPRTRDAWQRMRVAAHDDGVALRLNWAFRSLDDQALLIRYGLRNGHSIRDLLQRVAAPGFSEHHTGRALDSGTAGCSGPGFERTQAYAWLCQEASNYGFVETYPPDNRFGIMFEPWHWCWHPPDGRVDEPHGRD